MTADDLRKARVTLRLTQRQMALALGEPYGTYLNWEHGRYAIDRHAATHIRLALAGLGYAQEES